MNAKSELISRCRANVPEALRTLPIWLLWAREPGADGRDRKVPLYADGRNRGKCDTPLDRGKLVSFEEAAEALGRVSRAHGLGIALGRVPSADLIISGLDFDDCYRDAELDERVEKIVHVAGSYAERSPSGAGLHVVGLGDVGCMKKDSHGFELYSRGRFFTVTGNRINGSTVADLAPAAALTRELFGAGRDESGGESGKRRKIQNGARNNYLNRIAYRLRKQGMSREHILERLRVHNIDEMEEPLDDAELSRIVSGKEGIAPDAVTARDFWGYSPSHSYMYVPTRELWPGASVNVRCRGVLNDDGSVATKTVERKKKDGTVTVEEVPYAATEWLDLHRSVEQMTWAPGMPLIIEDRLIAEGGWIERPGCRVFNLYLPPVQRDGDPTKATPWIDHVRRVYPDDAEHIIRWLAHRVQHPEEKINHALFLGGAPGIGKDTILEPVKRAIGPWNMSEVSPKQLLGRFNGFLKSVILRVSEARDMGDIDRFGLYESLKTIEAAPPDVLRVDEKNIREHPVMNVTGVIITSNHKTDGIYLPPDDRRHYVAWSDRTQGDFAATYWRELYAWYESGGYDHVASYLRSVDLSNFDPKAPPPKTAAFWSIVDAGRAPEDADLADTLERLGHPQALTIAALIPGSACALQEWLQDRRNARQIPHRLEAAGYEAIRNPAATDGLWRVKGRRQVIYARRELPVRDRLAAAAALARDSR